VAKLNIRQYIFKNLDTCQIASLLWRIFMDARRFFSRHLVRLIFVFGGAVCFFRPSFGVFGSSLIVVWRIMFSIFLREAQKCLASVAILSAICLVHGFILGKLFGSFPGGWLLS
jgi:hypothetical protein